MKSLAIDLFCGLGGWTEGLLAEGWDVIGFDIERRPYPAQLVLQDVLTLHGSQFKDAALIVASPPCQKYSYMAMPWTRAKKMAAEYRSGERSIDELNALFNACFRIASEAGVPLVVENVRGAQPWVGPAKWNYGSFYLWGDVPALMPFARFTKVPGLGAGWRPPGHPDHKPGVNNTQAERGLKVPGRSFQSAAVKTVGHVNIRDGYTHTRHLTNQQESDGVKGGSAAWFNDYKTAKNHSGVRLSASGSKSNARKEASAQIAKIPFPLARHIARVFKPFS